MRINKLIGALALSGICAAGVAYAAAFASDASVPATQADEANLITATWQLGEEKYDDISAVYSDESAFSASNLIFSGVTGNGTQSVQLADGSEVVATLYRTEPLHEKTTDNYVEFSLTPKSNVLVKSIDFDWFGSNTGNGRMDVELIVDGKVTSLATNLACAKINSASTDLNIHYSYTPDVPVASSNVSLRCYLYVKSTDTSARKMGFANVVITCESAGTSGEDPEPKSQGTITWAMGQASAGDVTAVTDPNGAFDTQFILGPDMVSDGTRSKSVWSVDGNDWACTQFQIKNRTEKDVKYDGEYIEFVVTPKSGKFLPTNLSFASELDGFGSGHISVTVSANGATSNLTSDYAPKRPASGNDQVTKDDCIFSKAIKNLEPTSGPVTVRIQMWNTNTGNGKRVGFADVVLTGDIIEDGETPVEPEKPEVPAEYASWDIIGAGTVQFKPNTNGGQWSYDGTKYEAHGDADSHVAYIRNNTSASVKFYCAKVGVYSATFNVCSASNPATVTYSIKNELGLAESSVVMPYNKEKGDVTVNFPDQISVGPKTLTVSFAADHENFICNFHAPSFTWIEEGEAPEWPAGWAVIPGTLNTIDIATDGLDAAWTKSSQNISYEVGQFGSITNGGWCSTNFFCDKAGAYEIAIPFTWERGGGQSDDVRIEITDLTTGRKEIDQHYNYVGGKTVQTVQLEGVMARGKKSIKFTFTTQSGGFITNIKAPTFNWVGETFEYTETPSGYLEMPGTLTLNKTYWTENGLRIENSDTDSPNFGWASNGASATAKVFCKEEGVYSLNVNFYGFYSEGDAVIEVIDALTDNVEAKAVHHLTTQGIAEIALPGKVTVGKKTLKITFQNVAGSFCANFYAPEMVKVGEKFASITDVTVEGATAAKIDGYDWSFNLPKDFSGENVSLKVASENCVVSAKVGETAVDVVDGKITIPTPAAGESAVVSLALQTEEGTFAAKQEYLVRMFHMAGVLVSEVTVDGKAVPAEVVDALNSNEGIATLAGNIYTAVPAVAVNYVDGSSATANVTEQGVATFSGKSGDDTKSFTLNIEGIHLYSAAANDKAVKIVYDDAHNKADGSWSDGLYTIRNSNSGWGGTQFKFKPGTHTLEVPSNVIVKQLVFGQLGDNYNDGKVINVISEGATVYLPTNSEFYKASKYDLVANIENHKMGAPISFTFENGGEPVAWFELLVEEFNYTDAPELKSSTEFELNGKNHLMVELTFDRAMLAAEGVYGDGIVARADGGTTSLKFPLWNLPWGETTTFTIPAANIKGVSGPAMENDIVCSIVVGEKPAAAAMAAEKFVVVTDVEELRAAVDAANGSNKSADAERVVIFVKNGDYDLGEQPLEFKGHNVSLIGESREGVMIHGNRTGISNPVLSTRNAHDTHLENLTVRNDFDFGQARKGVAVAHYGGVKDVLVNVTLQSQQDTQVTGESGYYLNCEIHGSADYICGGGNHYYDHCTFVMTQGGVITAPATSAAHKYGYVFESCRIKGAEGQGYSLGRPWQGEPRAYWLNTYMESMSSAQVWDGMSKLVTHFYEYNTMDGDGNPVDLSGRKNSPDSQNKYTPVLTDEEAAEFTVENVLGYVDSWLATEEIGANVAAPEDVAWNTKEGNNYIWWIPAEGAAGYMIFDNGQYVGYAPGDHNHFDLNTNSSFSRKVMARANDDHAYTVHSVTAKGSMSAPSMVMTSQMPTSIESVGAEEAVEVIYYNLQGQPVAPSYRGAAIKVEVKADGTRTVSKAILK